MATADAAMDVDVGEEILQMSAEDIARRTRLIENEIRVLKVRSRTCLATRSHAKTCSGSGCASKTSDGGGSWMRYRPPGDGGNKEGRNADRTWRI